MSRAVELHGHRGARGLFPENTIEAFAGALALGVDALELDVGVTADEVVVVTHDPALNPDITRAPNGQWIAARGPLIRDLTADELAHFDVGRIRPGTLYAALYPEQQPFDGARIPTLAAVYDLDRDVRLTIEIKSFPPHPEWTIDPVAMTDRVIAVVDAADAIGRTLIQSFDWRVLRHLRRTRPDVALAWLTCAKTLAASPLWLNGADPAAYGGSVAKMIAAEGGPVWGPEHDSLSREIIEEAHTLKLRVVPWTVNRPEDMARLIAWGVDGLISDRPDLAREVFSAERLPLPAPRPAATAGLR